MIKKWGFFSILFLLGFFLVVHAQVNFSEKIDDFTTDIWIARDGSLLVKESITYNFGQNFKHGIYREIPLKNVRINVERVTDEFENNYPFKITKKGDYLKIIIGDPQKLVSGRRIYNIYYKVQNAISFFKDRDELYWNITGNEWTVPIEKSSAILRLPQKISNENLKLYCFTGQLGSKAQNCVFFIKENQEILFQSEKSFNPQEGLTIVVVFPKGIIKEPNVFLRIFWEIEKYWFFLIPIFVFVYLLKKWWREGRDQKIRKAIVPQYEPPDSLRPAEVSLILKQKIEPRDISATLIDLAVRGFIKIKEVKDKSVFGILKERDYEIEKMKEPEELLGYEKLILEKLFKTRDKIKISSLRNKFYKDFLEITQEVYRDVSKKRYFTINPRIIISKWTHIGIGFIAVAGLIIYIFNNFSLFFSLLISGFLFLIFSPLMPKRSPEGTEALWYILGFKNYIATAEKYRAQFYEKENIFERYLPYAICFNLVDKWAKAFEGIYQIPPRWYDGYCVGSFSSESFSNSLNSFISSFGGLFSVGGISNSRGAGGGSGGGGGGSW